MSKNHSSSCGGLLRRLDVQAGYQRVSGIFLRGQAYPRNQIHEEINSSGDNSGGFLEVKTRAFDAGGAGFDAREDAFDGKGHPVEIWFKTPDRGLGAFFPLSAGYPRVVGVLSPHI